MTPETWDPTCTVITALIIPVASTTSRISPRSTFAVKCCGWPLRFSAIVAITPITTATPARISHLVFGFITSPKIWRTDTSLVSQCFDRIQVRGFLRWVVSEKHTHSDREQRRNHHRLDGHLHLPFQRLADQVRTDNPAKNPGGASDQLNITDSPKNCNWMASSVAPTATRT